MGKKKYGNELRRNIRARHEKGESYTTLSKIYNIPAKSIEYICENQINGGTRGCLEHVKRDDSIYVDMKFQDARVFKQWRDAVINKLKNEKKYKGQIVVHVGQSEFTYKSSRGYNITKCYIDLYKKRSANDGESGKS